MTRHSQTLFRIFLLLIAVALITFLIPLIQKESTQEIFTEIEQSDFSGVVLIVDSDTPLHKQSFGFSSCDKREKNSQDTVFAIGSITKMFTAAAIGQLEENGKLNIDDGIDKYLTGIPEDKTSITIKQLLEHTSGLGAYHETGELGDFEPMTRAKALNEIMNRPLLFTPGSRSEYSSSGYTLLALLIEAVSAEQYTTYIRNHILIPSKMASTGFWGEAFETIASTPNTHSGCGSPDHWHYSWVLVGNGGMVSTAGDLHRWVSALKGSSVLDANAKNVLVLINYSRMALGMQAEVASTSSMLR